MAPACRSLPRVHADLTQFRRRALHACLVRRSISVKLTLLPMLASAAVAAQPVTPDEAAQGPPPGAEPMLSPPGLTPTIDECREDPCNPRCPPEADECEPPVSGGGWIFRGGFGHYFWSAGG